MTSVACNAAHAGCIVRLLCERRDTLIRFDAVTKAFGRFVAVDQVSLNFEAGKTHVLLGSSGCGKSTLLRMILGLVVPDRGSVSVDGTTVRPTTRHVLRGKIGYVVQQGGLFPHLTVYRNLALPAAAQKWPKERIRRRVQALADMVGFDHTILARYPQQLSGGQCQRVGLMRALILDPPVLLLDEPLAALDPLVRADLQQQLHLLFTTLRKTVVFVTHDIREAVVLGHTITLMTQGRVVQHGAFAELVRQPASAFVTAFLNAQLPPPAMQTHL